MTERIFAFISLSLLVISIPGPTSLYVLSQGLTNNWKKPLTAIAGVVCANISWVFLCGIGVATIIRDSQVAFETMRGMGTAYLLYLGFTLLKNAKNAPGQVSTESAFSNSVAFAKGYLTSISNPKAALFYLSFLPQFVTGKLSYHTEIVLWGLGYVALVIIVMSIYGCLAFRIHWFIQNRAANTLLKRALGFGFLGSAIGLWKFGER